MDQDIQTQISAYYTSLHEWNASYEEYAKSVGLSFTSLSLLRAIYETENCTQKMLCENCFLPKQSVNTIITSFYKNGWVRLEELPEDRRNKTIHFTREGKDYAERILLPARQAELKAMNRLTEEQRRVFIEITKSYVESCKEEMQRIR